MTNTYLSAMLHSRTNGLTLSAGTSVVDTLRRYVGRTPGASPKGSRSSLSRSCLFGADTLWGPGTPSVGPGPSCVDGGAARYGPCPSGGRVGRDVLAWPLGVVAPFLRGRLGGGCPRPPVCAVPGGEVSPEEMVAKLPRIWRCRSWADPLRSAAAWGRWLITPATSGRGPGASKAGGPAAVAAAAVVPGRGARASVRYVLDGGLGGRRALRPFRQPPRVERGQVWVAVFAPERLLARASATRRRRRHCLRSSKP